MLILQEGDLIQSKALLINEDSPHTAHPSKLRTSSPLTTQDRYFTGPAHKRQKMLGGPTSSTTAQQQPAPGTSGNTAKPHPQPQLPASAAQNAVLTAAPSVPSSGNPTAEPAASAGLGSSIRRLDAFYQSLLLQDPQRKVGFDSLSCFSLTSDCKCM